MTDAQARPAPLVPGAGETSAEPPPYARSSWEAAVIASDLPHTGRLLALILAHLAGPAGRLPGGGGHQADHLAHMARLPRRQTQISLNTLERAGYISRPDMDTWARDKLRPITLTIPAAETLDSLRTEPPHPGEPR